jgi:hypothetical protein
LDTQNLGKLGLNLFSFLAFFIETLAHFVKLGLDFRSLERHSLHITTTGTYLQVTHRLIHEQFFKRPLFNVARLVFFQIMNVLNLGTHQTGFSAREHGYH